MFGSGRVYIKPESSSLFKCLVLSCMSLLISTVLIAGFLTSEAVWITFKKITNYYQNGLAFSKIHLVVISVR